MSVALEQFRRVNPYPGLMVDVDVWRDAHDYHRAQLHLHHLALHGWGIVYGLDVALVDGSDNTLRIEPGLAVDPAGNFISVPQSHTYQITARERQQVYIVLQLREVLSEPAAPSEANRSTPHTRVIEAYRIQERDRLPEEPYIELARVDFVPGRAAVKAPADPEKPGQNQLDLRARVRLGTLAAPVFAPPAPSRRHTQDGSDGLAPRVDSLSDQLRILAERIDALAAAPPPVSQASEVEPSEPQPDPRVSELAERVQQLSELAERVQRLAEQVDALAAAGPAIVGQGSEGEGGAARPDPRVSELTERVQRLAGQVEALAAAGPVFVSQGADGEAGAARPDPRVSELAERVQQLSEHSERVQQLGERAEALGRQAAEGLEPVSQRFDGLAQQVEAVARQVEALEQRGRSDAEASVAPVAQRLDGLAQHIDGLAQRNDGLAQRIDGLAGDVGSLAGRVEASSRDIEALERDRGSVQATPMAAPTGGQVGQTVLQLAVAQHTGAGWDAHRDGVRFLARELTNTTHFDGQPLDTYHAGDPGAVDVLYVSGHAALTLSDAEADGIARVLDSGGVVIGEGCAAGPNAEGGAREFAMSFVDLANRLGRQLTRVDRSHTLMHARHVFGEPPVGGRATARVLESGGMVYSDADYGCAWQGGPADKAMPRAAIRDALEFGTNLAIFRR